MITCSHHCPCPNHPWVQSFFPASSPSGHHSSAHRLPLHKSISKKTVGYLSDIGEQHFALKKLDYNLYLLVEAQYKGALLIRQGAFPQWSTETSEVMQLHLQHFT